MKCRECGYEMIPYTLTSWYCPACEYIHECQPGPPPDPRYGDEEGENEVYFNNEGKEEYDGWYQ